MSRGDDRIHDGTHHPMKFNDCSANTRGTRGTRQEET